MEIMFQTTGSCNLNCHFCAWDYLPRDRKTELLKMKMDYNTFKRYVVKCLDYGFDTFQLTPIVGDPLMDRELIKKIELLHRFPSVKRVSFFTNFIAIYPDQIGRLLDFDKLTLSISVYGLTEDDFVKTTRCDGSFFKTFAENLNYFVKNYKPSFKSVEMFIRCPWDRENSYVKTLIKMLKYLKKDSDDYYNRNNIAFMDWNGNWCGLVPDNTFPNQRKDTNRKGVCWFALIDNTIDPSGDVGLCGACDVMKDTVIGNLNQSSFDEIYKEGNLFHHLITYQHQGIYVGCCKNCSEHHEVPFETNVEFMERYGWYERLISR